MNNLYNEEYCFINSFGEQGRRQKDLWAKEIKSFETWIKDTFNWDSFLWWGTLLGTIRDGDFIPHDSDIDIGIYIGEYDRETWIKTVKEKLWTYLEKHDLWRFKKKVRQVKILTPSRKLCLDCWAMRSENGKLEGQIVSRNHIDISDVVPFTKAKLRGVELNVPKNSEKVLSVMYNNWKVPIINKNEGRAEWRRINE
jgi:predicted nucleotidyltransferase